MHIGVQCFENIYPFTYPYKKEKREIKIGIRNTLYRKRMRDLINTSQEGYVIEHEFENRKKDKRIMYFCPKCKKFVTNKGIVHEKNCEFFPKKEMYF